MMVEKVETQTIANKLKYSQVIFACGLYCRYSGKLPLVT